MFRLSRPAAAAAAKALVSERADWFYGLNRDCRSVLESVWDSDSEQGPEQIAQLAALVVSQGSTRFDALSKIPY